MKVVVYNLGCKVNQYECDSMVGVLREKGYEVSEKLECADIYILNTCAVTNEAERKSRQCVERCLKLNKNADIYVCGCASEHNATQFISKDGVKYVIGTANKMDLINSFENRGVKIDPISNKYEDTFSSIVERTRAYVKVQDGCNKFCSYCLIPFVRGRSRSREINAIVCECEKLSKFTKEIVITGVDLSDYGKDIGTDFTTLIKALCNINCRIRLGSLEMNIITEELLQALSNLKAFCPHFHLSLQSGDDAVLKAMNRHYTTESFLHEVELIRKYFPNAGITTDLICGFPGESEENFNNTLKFLETAKFSQVHIFPYSKREGTVAAKMKQVLGDVSKDRCRRAEIVAHKTKIEYLQSMIGKKLEVFIEEKEGEYFAGYSREYIRVKVKDVKEDEIVNVIADTLDGDTIIGKEIN